MATLSIGFPQYSGVKSYTPGKWDFGPFRGPGGRAWDRWWSVGGRGGGERKTGRGVPELRKAEKSGSNILRQPRLRQRSREAASMERSDC